MTVARLARSVRAVRPGVMLALLVLCVAIGNCDRRDYPTSPLRGPIGRSPRALRQVTISPIADTYIRSGSPNQNQGADSILRLQQSGNNRALIRWDRQAILSAVGSDSIVSGTLQLSITFNADNWGTAGQTVELHRLTRSWTELGATWNCAIDASPSNGSPDCSGLTAWVMGSPDSLHPWEASPSAVQTLTNGERGTVSFDVSTDLRLLVKGTSATNGWILKKTDETLSGRVDLGSRENANPPQIVLTLVSTSAVVPAQPPDSVPISLYVASNFITDSTRLSVPFLKDIVDVLFTQGATQNQKQAAIDQVRGSVVGGIRFANGNGYYVVQVPGDGSAGPTFSALASLGSLPYVVDAEPEMLIGDATGYLRPQDGSGWGHGDWQLNPDSATGSKWGLEQIAAPMAWGCTTGSANVPIAVVDNEFLSSVQDLDKNLNTKYSIGINAYPGVEEHGTRVASVIGAVGNDTLGMTGVMWKASLRQYEVGQQSHPAGPYVSVNGVPYYDGQTVAAAVLQAATDGARVINLSLYIHWPGSKVPSDSADSATVFRSVNPLIKDLRTQLPQGTNIPLIVIIAGNNGALHHHQPLNAFWSGYPVLKDSFPNDVLVVGATDSNQAYPTYADTGRLVSVAAPGTDVGVLGVNAPTVVTDSGTSFSAPMVTGIAGLLLSFDSTLTTADLVNEIKAGAQLGGRTAQINGNTGREYQIVNAYESLKLAAQRPSAPLCGNRVWTTGTQVLAQRDTTNHSGEVLLNLLNDTASYLNVYHGGHRFEIFDKSFNTIAYSYRNGSWSNDTTAPSTAPGGTWLSLLQTSHDQDSAATVTSTVTPGLETLHIGVVTATTSQALVDIPISLAQGDTSCFWSDPNAFDDQGNITGYDCIFEGTVGASDRLDWRYAFTPYGGKILIAVTKFESTLTSNSGRQVCPWATNNPYPDLCVTATAVETALGTDIWEVDIASPQTKHIIWSTPGQVFWLASSEDGVQIVTAEGGVSQTTVFEPNPNWHQDATLQFEAQTTGPQVITSCGEVWKAYSSGAVLLPSVPNAAACQGLQGQGTISPTAKKLVGR